MKSPVSGLRLRHRSPLRATAAPVARSVASASPRDVTNQTHYDGGSVVIGGSSSVLACPVCFGAEETSMIDGTKLGVLVMLVITFAVQGAFLAFFLYLRKRAKHIADVDLDNEWSELQGAPKTL